MPFQNVLDFSYTYTGTISRRLLRYYTQNLNYINSVIMCVCVCIYIYITGNGYLCISVCVCRITSTIAIRVVNFTAYRQEGTYRERRRACGLL